MSHKVVSSIIALLFLVLIQSFGGVFRFLLPVMALYVLGFLAYNYWYLKKNNVLNNWSLIRPVLFIFSMIGLFFVVPDGFLKGLFLIFSVIVIYFLEIGLLVVSEQVVFLETLVSYFALSMAIFAWNFYLLPKSTLTLLLLGAMTFLIARASFDYVPQSDQKKNFWAALITFCLLEVSWALVFLPFHFTALAVILFNVFYVLWIIIYYYLFHNLNRQKISFHVIFSAILIVLIILSTPWKA